MVLVKEMKNQLQTKKWNEDIGEQGVLYDYESV